MDMRRTQRAVIKGVANLVMVCIRPHVVVRHSGGGIDATQRSSVARNCALRVQ